MFSLSCARIGFGDHTGEKNFADQLLLINICSSEFTSVVSVVHSIRKLRFREWSIEYVLYRTVAKYDSSWQWCSSRVPEIQSLLFVKFVCRWCLLMQSTHFCRTQTYTQQLVVTRIFWQRRQGLKRQSIGESTFRSFIRSWQFSECAIDCVANAAVSHWMLIHS